MSGNVSEMLSVNIIVKGGSWLRLSRVYDNSK